MGRSKRQLAGQRAGRECGFSSFTKLQWLGTLRGRVGYTPGNVLLYATAGYAAAGVEAGVKSSATGDPNKPWVKSARPVRIARSALAPNVPHADLYVTQGHAVLLDGLLIPAGNLVNGTTITLDAADEHDKLEFFHIKLESHDVIYAEGAPCETLLRVDETMSNFADYLRKHGEQDARDVVHCAPITGHGRRSAMMTRARRLVSPFLGPQKIDIISARLGSRAARII